MVTTSDQERVAPAQQPVAWLTEWTFDGMEWVHAHANELTAIDEARHHKGTVTPLVPASSASSEPEPRAEIERLTRERDELRACEASWEQTRLAIAQMRNENGGLRSRVEALSAALEQIATLNRSRDQLQEMARAALDKGATR